MTPAERLQAAYDAFVDAEGEGTYTSIGEGMAADPALADAIGLGLAWARVEAALPRGWMAEMVVRTVRRRYPWPYQAVAQSDTGDRFEELPFYGPTPAAALDALADVLEARQP